jgi:hypothetical protein
MRSPQVLGWLISVVFGLAMIANNLVILCITCTGEVRLKFIAEHSAAEVCVVMEDGLVATSDEELAEGHPCHVDCEAQDLLGSVFLKAKVTQLETIQATRVLGAVPSRPDDRSPDDGCLGSPVSPMASHRAAIAQFCSLRLLI